MAKKQKPLSIDEPLRHPDHPVPTTRRDFLRQGFITGAGTVMGLGTSVFSLFANPKVAHALSADINQLAADSGCPVSAFAGQQVPFICFDLAGGANFSGSNVLVGGPGGPLDLLSTAGYSKLGLPGDMLPETSTGNFIDTSLGLPFHASSAMLMGILEKTTVATRSGVNGSVIPARSANDTANNPHNPMYGLTRAGLSGDLVTLIGSQNSDSGGRSMNPAIGPGRIDPTLRPTKVDRVSDVTGMVDTGNLIGILSQSDATAVMESMVRLSDAKLGKVDTKLGITAEKVVEDLVRCGYIKAADIAERFGDPSALDPSLDPDIVSDTGGIFTTAEFNANNRKGAEFRKTASIMKLVLNRNAGAGTIAMGGYDYHTGDRSTGEARDLLAGRCIGACLDYARRLNTPLMIYVFSDGSLASNGMIDDTAASGPDNPGGGGKGVWTGDNSSTAASFMLVFNPSGAITPIRQQIGHFRADGSVDTSSSRAANNVNLLVETVILNYMALHGTEGTYASVFPNQGLGNSATQASMIAFPQIV